jgi:hypothetical protein
MRIDAGGVTVYGGGSGPPPIVKLRCDNCDITRFEQRADIEQELAEPSPSASPTRPAAKTVSCPCCRGLKAENQNPCPHCRFTEWPLVVGAIVVSLVCGAAAIIWFENVFWLFGSWIVCGLTALLAVTFCIGNVKALRRQRRDAATPRRRDTTAQASSETSVDAPEKPQSQPAPPPAAGGANALAALFNNMSDQGAAEFAKLLNQSTPEDAEKLGRKLSTSSEADVKAMAQALNAGSGELVHPALARAVEEIASSTQAVGKPTEPAFLNFACRGCGKKLRVRVALAGKKAKCPQCQQAVGIPLVETKPPAEAAAPRPQPTPPAPSAAKPTAPARSYYGLSTVAGNKAQYSGPLKKMNLEGSDIPDFIRQLLQGVPSAHLLILPQMGVVIAIKSSNDFLAYEFRSPMSVGDGAEIMSSMLRIGRRVQMVERYGAIELL